MAAVCVEDCVSRFFFCWPCARATCIALTRWECIAVTMYSCSVGSAEGPMSSEGSLRRRARSAATPSPSCQAKRVKVPSVDFEHLVDSVASYVSRVGVSVAFDFADYINVSVSQAIRGSALARPPVGHSLFVTYAPISASIHVVFSKHILLPSPACRRSSEHTSAHTTLRPSSTRTSEPHT